MIKQKVFLILIFTNILTSVYAQNGVNQFDKNGERHGVWTKNYHDTNQIRYRGVFEHGKEVGEFKYYKLNGGKSVLSATKTFNKEDNVALVKFYASNGKVISMGKMNGKNYIGKWTYYHNNSSNVMMLENYNDNGLLNGERQVYYKNGIVAEHTNYSNGKLDGIAKWFSEQGNIIKSYVYKNHKLNGEAIYYDSTQNVSSKGFYKDNKKVEIWDYFENGILKKRIDHSTKTVIPAKN